MLTGEDICFEAPVSERLYKGFTEMLMPELEKAGFAPVKLVGPVTSETVRQMKELAESEKSEAGNEFLEIWHAENGRKMM